MDKKRSISGRVRNKKNIFSVIVSLISFKLSMSIHLTRVNCSRLSGLPLTVVFGDDFLGMMVAMWGVVCFKL